MSEWISVKDRLPGIDVWVLWIDGNKSIRDNRPPFHHIDKIDKRREAFVNYLHNYTHWMPLPEPPKECE